MPKRKKKRRRNRERERERKKEKRGKEGKRKKNERKRDKKEKIKVSQHDERGAMQFQAQAGAQGKKTSGAPNWRWKEIKTMSIFKLIPFLVSKKEMSCSLIPLFWFLCFILINHTSAVPHYRKKLVILSWQMGKEVNLAPLSSLLVRFEVEHMWHGERFKKPIWTWIVLFRLPNDYDLQFSLGAPRQLPTPSPPAVTPL